MQKPALLSRERGFFVTRNFAPAAFVIALNTLYRKKIQYRAYSSNPLVTFLRVAQHDAEALFSFKMVCKLHRHFLSAEKTEDRVQAHLFAVF
ncbi:hypothetical protein ACIQW9_13885 [Herminiimonas sp. NPDC097707]|uniref:hypothetical protein n=1 Tax=Herminiimonas sp. NPDC097707 TaxID=3364007 RepID=UPI00383A48C3